MSDSAFFAENDEAETWFVDSGASTHMRGNKHWFDNFKETTSDANIYLGDDRGYHIKGYGNILVILSSGNIRSIQNVIYVLGIKKNPISVSMIIDQNLKVEFLKSYCIIKDLLDHLKPIATGIRVGSLYKLNVTSTPHQALNSTSTITVNLQHQRLGHINLPDLLLLQKQGMVNGLPILKNAHVDCEGYTLGKMHRSEFPSSLNRTKRDILELVHTDICGPM